MDFFETEEWIRDHEFDLPDRSGEKKITYVILITAVMMVAEVVSGMAFGSMALLADGWHMGTHVLALGVAFFAYYFARKHARDPVYVFGTGKISVLGGFASAVMLGFAAILICFESVEKFFNPATIRFDEAMIVAVIGLIVNLVSALMLHQGHHHHDHGPDQGDDQFHTHSHGHDHNLRAAYFHVAADALTSLTAIFALSAGKYLGWTWLDPFMGAVGSLVILKWAYGLMKSTSGLLIDKNENLDFTKKVAGILESDGETRILDLHVWRINQTQFAAVVSLMSKTNGPGYYRNIIGRLSEIAHVTVEVDRVGS